MDEIGRKREQLYSSFPEERLEAARRYVEPVIDDEGLIIGYFIPESIPHGVHPFELPPFSLVVATQPSVIPEGIFSHPNGIYPFLNHVISPIGGYNYTRAAKDPGVITPKLMRSIFQGLRDSVKKYGYVDTIDEDELLQTAWQTSLCFTGFPMISDYVREMRRYYVSTVNPRKMAEYSKFHDPTYPTFYAGEMKKAKLKIDKRWEGLEQLVGHMRLDAPEPIHIDGTEYERAFVRNF
ncbi:MAG: hypothetical protein QY318_00010 [Candidatus Dojkabacteria bacterium]|nr:MAG: hypothetical protein QY318_00010 [Candidatus Dojkabacteria bacterium]